MITDSQTNKLFLADCLPKMQPKFFERFKKVLDNCNINFEFLPETKDIWAVDFMPLQISKDKFVKFVYNPDYLRKTIKGRKSISDVNSICKAIGITPKEENIVLDGGNVIRTKSKVIMTDKVFTENPTINEKQLIKMLKDTFEVDDLFFVPKHPKDFTGHADGIVRFLDNDTVLINDYSKENTDYQRNFRLALYNAGLDYVEIPYSPVANGSDSAKGFYINYLQMKQAIILPTFGIETDDKAVKQFEQLFSGQKIMTIDSNEIANKGGILNCITWNIANQTAPTERD